MARTTARWVTPAEAVQAVQSGDTVVVSHACGEPRVLPGELVKRADELHDVKVVSVLVLGDAPYCRPEYTGSFRHISLFAGAKVREAVNAGRADFMPCFFGQVPSLLGDLMPVDVAMVSVSPPDKDGYCSLGVSTDYARKAVKVAHTAIAEVNPTMPRLAGDAIVHVSDFDYLVEVDTPIFEVGRPVASDEECQAGAFVADLIGDGDTIQVGIGALPEVVCGRLNDRRDLGIHSEMISDGVKELVEMGVVTNARKTLHPGKIIATFIMGTRELYKWLDGNPLIEMRTVDYTNNPYVIAQNRNMVSVNAALEVDLLGQVCADTLGPKQFSGVGGQVDYVRGARLSDGGRAIIVMTSTACNGEVSRIVPLLKPGAVVTTSRNDVDYVVTEYGAAKLHGKTTRERVKALIDIAHPKFRDDLTRQAWEVFRQC